MEISDIVSPTYSIASNILKLNSSSIASSTPSCHLLGPLVQFQEFQQSQVSERPSYPKKKLTIQIDEPFVFQHQSGQSQQQLPHNQLLMIETPESQISEPPFVESTCNKKCQELQLLLSQSLRAQESLSCQNDQLRQSLKKKEELLLREQQMNTDFAYKLAQFQEIKAQQRFYDERMREKESKLKQLQKIHEKVVLMNRNLQKELRESEKKIMDLEKEVQRNICSNQQQNLVKIKQSSTKLKESYLKLTTLNKENALSNCGRSIERKKGSGSQVKKTGRSSASSSNLTKKLLTKNALL